jgi:hypothetical protein
MWDNLHSPDDRSDLGISRTPADRGSAPLSDREVPIDPHRTPAAIHAWLDGDVAESEVRRGDMVKDVEFWNQIGKQADARRRMRTPAHVQGQIMAAIVGELPGATPWLRRPLRVNRGTILIAGAILLALGVMIGAAVMTF